jgi:competence protein ComEA
MALLLGVLAGIGVVATTYAKPGAPLPDGPSSLVDALGTAWLKPTPASSSPEHSARPTGSVSSTPIGNERVPATSAAPTASAEPPSAGPGITVDGKVILNVASADELTKLPGVGQKRALAIVALRTKLKRFRQATDLLRVKGIGPRGLKRMLPHLVLDPPS